MGVRGRVGKKYEGSPTVTRVHSVVGRSERMKMGVDYRIRRTSQVVAGRMHAAGLTKAGKGRKHPRG